MTSKQLLIGAGAASLLIGVPYLLQLKRLSEELETVTKVNIHSVNLSGLTLRVDVLLKNPSGGNMTLKYPFVKMQHNDTTFATSEVRNEDFELPKFSQKQLDPIFIEISLISLATQAPALVKEYRTNGKLSFVVKIITTLNGRIPFTKTDTINL
jgi:hypothetical protein